MQELENLLLVFLCTNRYVKTNLPSSEIHGTVTQFRCVREACAINTSITRMLFCGATLCGLYTGLMTVTGHRLYSLLNTHPDVAYDALFL